MTIIVKILGGMGNQMFQYAAAKSLALKHQTDLLLDTESLHRHGERPFDLSHFVLPDKIVALSDYTKLGLSFLSYPLIRLKKHPRYYFEESFIFNTEFFNFNSPIYLDGYFQSEHYFSSFQRELRNIFTFKAEENDNELKILNLMKQGTPVSLHVRRGDYITNPKANAQMENLDLVHYQRAMELLERKISNPIYFIFSDDSEWIKNNLKIKQNHFYVLGNSGRDAFRDMRLMSQCHHHIIANSSFSWWGAWLNARRDKLVIAPKIWFRDGTNDRDLIPSSWIRV